MAHPGVSTQQHLQFWLDSFHIWHKLSLAWESVLCTLTSTYIFRSFSHDVAMKLLKYGTSCHVHSAACTVLDGFSPYLALMITSMRGCVMLWPWPISCLAVTLPISWIIFMCHKYNPWRDNVSRFISRSIGQRWRSHRFEFLQSGLGVS